MYVIGRKCYNFASVLVRRAFRETLSCTMIAQHYAPSCCQCGLQRCFGLCLWHFGLCLWRVCFLDMAVWPVRRCTTSTNFIPTAGAPSSSVQHDSYKLSISCPLYHVPHSLLLHPVTWHGSDSHRSSSCMITSSLCTPPYNFSKLLLVEFCTSPSRFCWFIEGERLPAINPTLFRFGTCQSLQSAWSSR
jgi:hypothetical protein